jgi:hypothetical protein
LFWVCFFTAPLVSMTCWLCFAKKRSFFRSFYSPLICLSSLIPFTPPYGRGEVAGGLSVTRVSCGLNNIGIVNPKKYVIDNKQLLRFVPSILSKSVCQSISSSARDQVQPSSRSAASPGGHCRAQSLGLFWLCFSAALLFSATSPVGFLEKANLFCLLTE